jgi:hypothetical protein
LKRFWELYLRSFVWGSEVEKMEDVFLKMGSGPVLISD